MKKIIYFATVLLLTAGSLASCGNKESASPSVGVRGGGMSANGTGGEHGTGGSLARFAISGNQLYTVDNSRLHIFDVTNPIDPQFSGDLSLNFGVETIFPYGNHLFIGTQSGMYILNIQNPLSPTHVAFYEHVTSCDPVVTDGRYAYVTLSSGTNCMRAVNQLEVIDLQNISNPFLLAEYPMTNPRGLGIDGNNLFVCDNGLKLYDATQVRNLRMQQHFKINAMDVIPDNGNLLVIGSDGLYQYEYKNNALTLLSKLSIQAPL